MRKLVGVVVAVLAAATLLTGCSSLSGLLDQQPGGAAAPAVVAPTAIAIPSIEAQSTLVALGLNDDETVEVPPVEQPMQAGWYRHGTAPGEHGPAVILGHVDGGGNPGVFARLHELERGAEVLVTRADGSTAVFTVDRVDQVAKAEFPTEAVYSRAFGPELRIVTCGGAFDFERQSYVDNVIVYATLADVR